MFPPVSRSTSNDTLASTWRGLPRSSVMCEVCISLLKIRAVGLRGAAVLSVVIALYTANVISAPIITISTTVPMAMFLLALFIVYPLPMHHYNINKTICHENPCLIMAILI
jgi:hypothetical protein